MKLLHYSCSRCKKVLTEYEPKNSYNNDIVCDACYHKIKHEIPGPIASDQKLNSCAVTLLALGGAGLILANIETLSRLTRHVKIPTITVSVSLIGLSLLLYLSILYSRYRKLNRRNNHDPEPKYKWRSF